MISKKERKLLEHVYFLSIKKRNLMLDGIDKKLIKKINEASSISFTKKDVQELIERKLLIVQLERVIAETNLERIVVSEAGQKFLSDNAVIKGTNLKKELDIKRRQAKRRQEINFYTFERNSGFYLGFRLRNQGGKTMCLKCRTINAPCTHGKEFQKQLSVKARPPRKTAHKNKWKEFLKEFAPEGLVYIS